MQGEPNPGPLWACKREGMSRLADELSFSRDHVWVVHRAHNQDSVTVTVMGVVRDEKDLLTSDASAVFSF